MRIVTWNCCRGPFAKKLARLEALAASVTSIQECPRPETSDATFLWHGENQRQGLGLLVAPGYSLRPCSLRATRPYHLLAEIEGPHSFLALAVWTQRTSRYVEAVVETLWAHRDLILANPTVVLGDLNSNAIWDADHPGDRNHSALVRLCADLGLVSAYHQYWREGHGSESRPTYYFRWNKDRPYHIDYCFIPEAWASSLTSVDVGTYEGWADLSDHRPLVVDLALPSA